MWPLNHTLTKFCIYVQTFSYYTHSCIVWRTAVDDAIVFVAVIPDHIDGTAPIALQTQPHSTRHSIMTAAPPLASVGRCYFVCLRLIRIARVRALSLSSTRRCVLHVIRLLLFLFCLRFFLSAICYCTHIHVHSSHPLDKGASHAVGRNTGTDCSI